jgi:Copper type II ascorbate-dependent monooxygenase, C-terminal domain
MKRTVLVVLIAASALLVGSNISSAREVTFSKDVAPIVYRSCAECHRPGEIGPMSLLSYKDVRPWAKSIREKVIKREMPPWHADPNFGKWSNDRSLSQKDIDTITAWVDGGAREGDAKDLPPAPKFVQGWSIGTPDVVISVPEQAIPAQGVVPYQYITVPTNFAEDKWVSAAEIRSTGRSAMHHVIVFMQDPNGTGRGEGNLLTGTAPGEQPTVYREGFGKKIAAGTKFVFQLHYTPNGAATKDVTSIGLIFAKSAVKHQVYTRPIMNNRLVIPPGAPAHEVKSTFTFQDDVHVVSFMPHMHLRGKDFVYKAVTPDGKEQTLLNVPKYDFNWQTYYVSTEPLAIAKGTRIDCVAHFDNSAANKYNPDPTREVRWGDQTWEEMMIGWTTFYYDVPPAAKPSPQASTGSTK